MDNVFHYIQLQQCCGCSACIVACPLGIIDKTKDHYGFHYPIIEETSCIKCGKCLKVCPVLNDCSSNYPMKAYAAINKDKSIVQDSSSGGIFSSLASAVLASGGVVCGAAMNDDYTVSHIFAYSEDELKLLRKSKYVQSDLGDVYAFINNIIDTRPLLFSGTPCQVAGLYSYLGKRPKNLFSIDIACHGVPSNDFFKDYISFLEKRVGPLEKYEFRAKKEYNNGMNWYSSFQPIGKKKKIFNWPTDSYNYLYMNRKIYRDSCYNCVFAKKKRASDITLCDYWGWEKYHHGSFHPNASLSGVIVNTEKGFDLYERISSYVYSEETRYEHISNGNMSLISNSDKPKDREFLLDLWCNNGYEAINRLFVKENWLMIQKYKIVDIIPVSLLTTIKRVKDWILK